LNEWGLKEVLGGVESYRRREGRKRGEERQKIQII